MNTCLYCGNAIVDFEDHEDWCVVLPFHTRAAELLESNRELHEANAILRLEVEARRRADETVRALVEAHPEHDTTEAVRRCAANLRDVRAQLEAVQAERDEYRRYYVRGMQQRNTP